jgi:hypothetical protein
LVDGKPIGSNGKQLIRGAAIRTETGGPQDLADLINAKMGGVSPFGLAMGRLVDGVGPEVVIVAEKMVPEHPGAISRTRKNFTLDAKPGPVLLDLDLDGCGPEVKKNPSARWPRSCLS